MDMRVIHYFLAAAREGNITKAAKRLHMTQPTLSRHWQSWSQSLARAFSSARAEGSH